MQREATSLVNNNNVDWIKYFKAYCTAEAKAEQAREREREKEHKTFVCKSAAYALFLYIPHTHIRTNSQAAWQTCSVVEWGNI